MIYNEKSTNFHYLPKIAKAALISGAVTIALGALSFLSPAVSCHLPFYVSTATCCSGVALLILGLVLTFCAKRKLSQEEQKLQELRKLKEEWNENEELGNLLYNEIDTPLWTCYLPKKK